MKRTSTYSFTPYLSVCSVTLDSFDNSLSDYGVAQYFDTLQFLPHILFCTDFSQDFVLMHNRIIDDGLFPRKHSVDANKHWTRRQLRALADELHQYGVKMFVGFHGAWWSKSVWLEKHSELFITLRDGRKADNPSVFSDLTRIENKGDPVTTKNSSKPGMQGALNPLARTKEGEWFEDIFCKSIVDCLNDYHLDGVFMSEGIVGLSVTLNLGDYSDDMISQFSDFSSIQVKGTTTLEKSTDIWENHRAEWLHFYTKRWGSFYHKLSDALKSAGKELATMDAWARGPADSIYDFGIDYLELYNAGIDYYVMQSREENWGRRGHCDPFVWEPGQIAAVATIKARAPHLRLLWAVSACVATEHWNAIRDLPNVLERQLLGLPVTGFLSSDGSFKRSYDGYVAHEADYLTQTDWNWLTKKLSFSFTSDIHRMLGAAIVWSDSVYEKHCQMGERWQITKPISQLIIAGLPVRMAVNTKNLENADAEAFLVIDPVGMREQEINALIKKRKSGATLIVIGNIESDKLQKELGLLPVSAEECIYESVEGCNEPVKLRYKADAAEALLTSNSGKVLLSVQRHAQEGSAIYFASTRKWAVPVTESPSAFTEHKCAFGKPGYMCEFYDMVMPNNLEYFAAAQMKKLSALSVIVDEGQYAAYENTSGDVVVHLENMANLYYLRPKIYTAVPFCEVKEFDVKTLAPKTYVISSDPDACVYSVHVIADGAIPVALIKAKESVEPC